MLKFIMALMFTLVGCRIPEKDSSELQGSALHKGQPDCRDSKIYNPQATDHFIKQRMVKANVKLLIDNEEAWWARWQIIKQARRVVYIQYYIIEDDDYGHALLGLLIEKLSQGVQVKLMLDGRGSPKFTKPLLGEDKLQELVHAGAMVTVFNPFIYSFDKLYKTVKNGIRMTETVLDDGDVNAVAQDFITLNTTSNHDKIIVVDDQVSIVGGRNISRNYFASQQELSKAYDDMDVLIYSYDAAVQLRRAWQTEYAQRVNYDTQSDIVNVQSQREYLLQKKQEMDLRMRKSKFGLGRAAKEPQPSINVSQDFIQTFDNLPKGDISKVSILDNSAVIARDGCKIEFKYRQPAEVQISLSLLWAIRNAQKSIYIMNPYVVVTDELHEALAEARRKKVAVTLITNSILSSDSLLTQAAFINDWQHLLQQYPNLRLYVAKGPSKLHSKVFLFDDEASMVSSYNFDAISQNINSEIAAYIVDKKINSEIRVYLDHFIKDKSVELYYKNGEYHGFNALAELSEEFHQRFEKVKKLLPFARMFRDRI